MATHNAENERIKRRYVDWLKETQGFSEASLDQVLKAISRYEIYTKFRDFRSFHIEQVKGFKRHLSEQKSERSGDPLSHATIYSTLSALKAFFQWLAGQPNFKSCFSFGDWEYFSPSGVTASVAKAHRTTRAPNSATDPEGAGDDARPHRHRAEGPGACRLRDRDWSARPGRRVVPTSAYRHRAAGRLAGRPAGEDEVPQDVRDLVFSRRRRH